MEPDGGKKKKKKRKISAMGVTGAPFNNRLRGRRHALTADHFWSDKRKKLMLLMVENRDVKKITDELSKGVDLAESDETSELLRCACQKGQLDMVAVLVRYGAPLNVLGDEMSPLHTAVKGHHTPIVALLLSHGADINIVSKSEARTPLHLAAMYGHDDLCRMLLQNEASVNQGDIYGTSALHLACRLGRTSVAELLLEYKAEINLYDNEGWTALHLAAEAGHLEVTELLVQHDAHVDCQNKYGRTPLHWAVVAEHLPIVRKLLESDASTNICDRHEKKAVEYCSDLSIRRLLDFYNYRYTDKGMDQVAALGTSMGDLMPRDMRTSMYLYQRMNSQTNSSDSTSVSGRHLSVASSVGLSQLDGDDLDAAIPEDARMGKTQFMQMISTSTQQITAMEWSIEDLGAQISKLKDKKVTPDQLRELHKRGQQTQGLIDDFKHEFQFEMTRLWTLFDEHLTRIGSKLYHEIALPPVVYCRFVLVAAKHIARVTDAWQKIATELSTETDLGLREITDVTSDETTRASEVLVRMFRVAQEARVPVIKYSMDFLEKCDVPGINTKNILSAFVFFEKNGKGKEITIGTLDSLATSLGKDGQKLASSFGMSSERLTAIHDQAAGQVYDINFAILAEWQMESGDVSAKDKVLTLTETLIGIGREDVLTAILDGSPAPTPRASKAGISVSGSSGGDLNNGQQGGSSSALSRARSGQEALNVQSRHESHDESHA